MSKFSRAIEALQSGTKKIVPYRPYEIAVTHDAVPVNTVMRVGTEYRIQVKMEMRGFVQNREEMNLMMQNARQALIHEMFGEFRPYFQLIDAAMWEYDFEEARRLLTKFQAEMFT